VKVKGIKALLLLFLITGSLNTDAAVSKTVWPNSGIMPFVFVENNGDNNYFVTPGAARDPRMTGSNRWTGLKYGGTGPTYQVSLGYIDNGYNTGLNANWKFDMWLENSPISQPLLGLRCINWYAGCNMATSLILPATTDSNGFYGVTVTPGGAKWMHGMMSDAFFYYLQQLPVGDSFTMSINTCQTSVNYDASSGARCKDQASGAWYVRNVTQMKAAHMKLINTGALSEVFINSDGVPTLGAGSSDCTIQTIGSLNGLSCRMVNYSLQNNGLSNSSISMFPAITNPTLLSAISGSDLQFSLDGKSWKRLNGTASYYNFNELKNATGVYVFFSSNFFKKMVDLGLSDSDTKDLLAFRFQNSNAVEAGWYEFSTSNTLIIKPREFSVSIISDELTTSPKRSGSVGGNEPSLDFGYFVTTSGKTAADEVLIKVKGPAQNIGGRSYCIFSSEDGLTKVPFPAFLSFITSTGEVKKYDAGCDDGWHDMTDALWLTTPWVDISGDAGQLDKTTVKFSIPMDNAISQRTVDNNGWFGEVSASGEIHVQATWRDIN
jgi:Mat/Ecp fimbriae adhesin